MQAKVGPGQAVLMLEVFAEQIVPGQTYKATKQPAKHRDGVMAGDFVR